MTISKAARMAALLAGFSVLTAAVPAAAQPGSSNTQRPGGQAQPNAQAQQDQRRFNLSRDEQRAVTPLVTASQAALTAQQAGQPANWAGVQALLPAAVAVARSNDARYLVAKVQYLIAVGTNDAPGREAALNAIASNPFSLPNEVADARRELTQLKNRRAEQAFAANDFVTAERLFAELQRENPTDERIARNLAVVRGRMGNVEGALEPILQQIRTSEASGGRASEANYRRVRDTYYTARNGARAQEFAIALARHYPTAENWRDAVAMYREFNRPQGPLILASYRLQRAANALNGEADFLEFAQLLRSGGYAGETRAVIDAGITRGAYTRQRQGVPQLLSWADENISRDRAGLDREAQEARRGTSAQAAIAAGDALYGYGRYADAAGLYRAALTKSGANADLINLNLGAALAMAGQRAEAEAALRAVRQGPHAGLAALWLAWLARAQG